MISDPTNFSGKRVVFKDGVACLSIGTAVWYCQHGYDKHEMEKLDYEKQLHVSFYIPLQNLLSLPELNSDARLGRGFEKPKRRLCSL